jgi:hypothetical protein
MFGRKRKKEEESTGLAGLSDVSITPSSSITPSVTVTPSTSPTPAPPPPAPPAPTAGAAPGAGAAGATPGAITPQVYATMSTSGPAMLAQILSGHGPVGELIAQIKADPQGFRDRMIAQAQAAGVSTYVMTPQGMSPLAGAGAAPPQHVDVIDELTKAANLHDQGALTDEEFESLKKKLLGQ